MIRRITRVALGVAMAAGLATPTVARAHGHLKSSTPASGAHLAAAPRELRLTFNERVELAVSRIELVGPDGRPIALSAIRAGDSAAVVVADIVGPLTVGSYDVAWQVVGRDGHPVRGQFRFTIAPGASGLGAASDTSAVRAPPADTTTRRARAHHDPTAMPTGGAFDVGSPLFAAARWLAFAATLALIGAVGFANVVVPRAARAGAPVVSLRAADERARTLGLIAAVALLVASLLRLAAQSVAMHGAADAMDAGLVTSMLRGTTWGIGWLVQVGAALIALIALLARRGRVTGWRVAAASVVAIAVGAALSGHAASVPGATAVAVSADAGHVLGAGGWLGTLLALVLVGLPAARLAPDRGAAAAALVEAFSPVALACATVLAATGLAAAWWHVGSLGALSGTTYGRLLLLKLAALAVVAGTGAYNWRRVRPAMGDPRGPDRLRRSATVELLVGALVLAVTAVLVAIPTPMDVVR